MEVLALYAHWSASVHPAFGENITAAGVLEAETLIGEVWRIGGATVQVTQPRSPCAKVAARLGIPDLVMQARRARLTGLHLRVLEVLAVPALAEDWRVKTAPRLRRAAWRSAPRPG